MENICFQKTSAPSVNQEVQRGHRMAEVGRNLWRSFDSSFLLKQDHLELVAQDDVHMAF